MVDVESDLRDIARAFLSAQTRDEFYATLYPKPGPMESPWNPVSILTEDEVRRVALARYLKRRYGIEGPSLYADEYIRIVVSRRGIGREQAVRMTMGSDAKRASFLSRLNPLNWGKSE